MVARARNQSYQWRWHRQKLRFRVDPGLVASSRSSWRTSLGIVSWRRGDSTFPGLLFTADRASVFKELLKTERGSRVFQTSLRFLAGAEATSSLFLFFRTRVISMEIRCIPWVWRSAAASRNGYVVSGFVSCACSGFIVSHRIAFRALHANQRRPISHSSRRSDRHRPSGWTYAHSWRTNANAWSATGRFCRFS